MTAALRILDPGLRTTVQDRGRPGYQWLGVPISGALDSTALAAANLVAGNPPGTAALEVCGIGPLVEVEADAVRLAVAGLGMRIEVHGDHPISPLQTVTLGRGERARIVAPREVAVGYLAIAGGIGVAEIMGSRSTTLRARLGGFEGRALATGDRLPLTLDTPPPGPERRATATGGQTLDLSRPAILRVLPAPPGRDFAADALAELLAATWRVTAAADRMGARLEGPRISTLRAAEGLSAGIAPGAIQIPGDGQPILLLADRQTTGGYPCAAHVVSADLPAAGRLRHGDRIRFEVVSVAEAAAARNARASALACFAAAIETESGAGSTVDDAALATANLVSGVTRGDDPG